MLRDNPRGWNGVGGGREVQEGRDVCISMADSCGCMAETNTTLYSNYPQSKTNTLEKIIKKQRFHPAVRLATF